MRPLDDRDRGAWLSGRRLPQVARSAVAKHTCQTRPEDQVVIPDEPLVGAAVRPVAAGTTLRTR